ncbi:MAG: BamA/TamA family outer membrane protein [Chloroherpetonaceae bacterium]
MTSLHALAHDDSLRYNSSGSTEKSSGWLATPFADYTPETDVAFGAAGIYTFRTGNELLDRPSKVQAAVTYTVRHQLIAEVLSDAYLFDGNYRAFADVAFLRFPDRFYGIGANSSEQAREDYTPEYVRVRLSLTHFISQFWNVGIRYELRDFVVKSMPMGGALASGSVLGSEGGRASGVGFVVNYDTRDNIFFPRAGQNIEFSATLFQNVFASHYNFARYAFDVRQYIPSVASHVIALHALGIFSSGDVPFFMMPMIGGQYQMRGYYEGRFRDNHLVVGQAEYRIPVWWRIGVNFFASVGTVASRISAFRLSDLKHSVGAGLRFAINEKEKLNGRLDFALGQNTSGFYITIEEAF